MPTAETLAKSLGQVAAAGGGDTFDGRELLKMDKTGEWMYGQEGMEVEPNKDEFAINPFSFQHGFICWKDEAVVGERMVPISNPLPAREDLGETGASWDEQLRFDLQTVGDEAPVELLYKITSHGGKKAVRKLAAEIVNRISAGSGYIVPVVTLDNDYYKHKKYGKIFTPIFNIVTWMNLEGEVETMAAAGRALEAPAEEEAPVEKPKSSRRSSSRTKKAETKPKAEPKPEPEDEGEEEENEPVQTPRRGRRRRSA